MAKASTFTKQEHPLFRRYVEKNRQGYQSTWLLPDGLGDHALLDGQDDIFIYAPYGKSYHKLIGNKRIKNGDKTCWRGVYTWFETPIADDADLLCYEGSAGGHTAVFIDWQAGLQEDAGTARIPRPAAFRNGRTERRHPHFGRRAE